MKADEFFEQQLTKLNRSVDQTEHVAKVACHFFGLLFLLLQNTGNEKIQQLLASSEIIQEVQSFLTTQEKVIQEKSSKYQTQIIEAFEKYHMKYRDASNAKQLAVLFTFSVLNKKSSWVHPWTPFGSCRTANIRRKLHFLSSTSRIPWHWKLH